MTQVENNSYIKLKEDPTKIYKVYDVDCERQIIDALQKDGSRTVLNFSEVEVGSDDDMLLYESDTQLEYY